MNTPEHVIQIGELQGFEITNLLVLQDFAREEPEGRFDDPLTLLLRNFDLGKNELKSLGVFPRSKFLRSRMTPTRNGA